MKYLVTGPAGAGKSTIASALAERGYVAYDTDEVPGASSFEEIATGRAIGFAEVSHPIDFRRFAWNWQLDALHELLESADDVFICAATGNTEEQRHLFDRVFALKADEATIRKRLHARTKTFGKHPAELAAVLTHNRVFVDKWSARGAVVIDATQPLDAVVDEIVSLMG